MTQVELANSLKTKPPFNVFMLGSIVVVLTWESISNPIWVIYMIPIWTMFYLTFCRYCCIISIDADKFFVHYLSLWNKDIILRKEDILKIDYANGFYQFFSDKSIVRYGLFPMYCQDRLIVYLKNGEIIEININTRIFDFRKILKWANEMRVLK